MIKVIAYQPTPGTPLEDYKDFPIGMDMSMDDVRKLTDMGHFPPGIVLRGECAGRLSRACVVRGHYNTDQKVEVL